MIIKKALAQLTEIELMNLISGLYAYEDDNAIIRDIHVLIKPNIQKMIKDRLVLIGQERLRTEIVSMYVDQIHILEWLEDLFKYENPSDEDGKF